MHVPTPVYEVRCLGCETSFPPGTRRCVHCGERIGRPAPVDLGLPEPLEDGIEEESPEGGGSVVRAALWGLSVMIALVGSLFRVCQGG